MFNFVSPHCLDRILGASETTALFASENIFDISGMKLLADGYKISPTLKERLNSRKLTKPLETSLGAEDGVTSETISKMAHQLIEEIPVLSKLCPDISEEANQICTVGLHPLVALLLTIMHESERKSFRHTVLVTLICRMLGRRLKLNNHTMSLLTQSAEVHDLGELYIDSAYFADSHILTPEEWKRTMAHPIIVEKLISGYTDYSPLVARAVLEHHERMDGSGYPNRLAGEEISELGQILMVAELLSSFIAKPNSPLQKICLVARVIPGEYPSTIVDIIQEMIQEAEIPLPDITIDPSIFDRVKPIVSAISEFPSRLQSHIETTDSASEKSISQTAILRMYRLKRAIIAMGFDSYFYLDNLSSIIDDPKSFMEIETASQELAWRMRNISREMVLAIHTSKKDASAGLQKIVDEMSQISGLKQI